MSYKVTREQLNSITDAEMAFGTERLLPPWSEIPDEFKGRNRYTELLDALFAGSPMPQYELRFLPGFEDQGAPAAINRVVRAHLTSYGPKHEHKIAGLAFLMSLVFVLENKA